MRKISKKQILVGGVAAAVVLAGAGTALAYWTDSGSGSSTATTGTSSPFAVVVTPAAGNASLAPAGPIDHYTFTVTNTGSGNQKVSAALVTVANNPGGTTWTSVPGCSASDYQISNISITPADLTPTGAGATTSGSFDVQMKDTNVSQDACKGASVPLYVAVS